MLVQPFLLMIALMLITSSPFESMQKQFLNSQIALILGIFTYLGFFALIYLQNKTLATRYRWKKILSYISEVELLCAVFIFHILLESFRAYLSIPGVKQSSFFFVFLSLAPYFFGRWVINYSLNFFDYPGKTLYAHKERKKRADEFLYFLIPFPMPVLFILMTLDVLSFWQIDLQRIWFLPLVLVGLFFLFLFLFFPLLVQKIWGCKDMEDVSFAQELEDFCRQLQFKSAGLKIWTILGKNINAAIIGIHPRFRYVIMSPALIERLDKDEIKAVLAHEIGHSVHRHLIFYPFVILGLSLIGFVLTHTLIEPINHYFFLQELLHTSALRKILIPIWNFLPLLFFFIVYIRFVFGFFSRNMERQADIHIFKTTLAVETLMGALDKICLYNHMNKYQKNWHHWGISERLNFLKACKKKPKLIEKHHRFIRKIKTSYFVCLFLILSSIVLLQYPPHTIFQRPQKTFDQYKQNLYLPTQQKITLKLIHAYQLPGPPLKLYQEIMGSFEKYGARLYPGILEFYSAQSLFKEGFFPASLVLMQKAWERYDFQKSDPSILEIFQVLSTKMIEICEKFPQFNKELEELKGIMDKKKKKKQKDQVTFIPLGILKKGQLIPKIT